MKDSTPQYPGGQGPSKAALRLMAVLLVLFGLAFAIPASASNYYLTDIDSFSREQLIRFRDSGIQTTEQLLEGADTPKARQALAKKVQVEPDKLLEVLKSCEMMQINGVGPKAARLIRASGATSIRDLASRTPKDFHLRIQAANKGGRYTQITPPLDTVRYWIEQAARAPYHIK